MGEEHRQVKMEHLDEDGETVIRSPAASPVVRIQILLDEFMMEMRQKSRAGGLSYPINNAWRSLFTGDTSSGGGRTPTNTPAPAESQRPEDLRIPIGRMVGEPQMVHLAQ